MNDGDRRLSLPLTALPVVPRVYYALRRAGVNTIGDLVQYTPRHLMSFRGIGATALLHVRLALGSLGLGLKDDWHADYFVAGHGGPPVTVSPQMLYELARQARLAQERQGGTSSGD